MPAGGGFRARNKVEGGDRESTKLAIRSIDGISLSRTVEKIDARSDSRNISSRSFENLGHSRQRMRFAITLPSNVSRLIVINCLYAHQYSSNIEDDQLETYRYSFSKIRRGSDMGFFLEN